MKKLISIFLSLIIISFSILSVSGHSGRTDANGGHYDRKTGQYHYHNGGYTDSNNSSYNNYSYNSSQTNSSQTTRTYANKIEVKNKQRSLNCGEGMQLKATVYPSDAYDKEVSWHSSDEDIAYVDDDGYLHSCGVGTVTVSVTTAGGASTKFKIKVKEIVATGIEIVNKPATIIIGDTLVNEVDFTPDDTTYQDIEWESDNDDIVYVDDYGEMKAESVGTTTIRAKHKELQDEFQIEVLPIEVESVEIQFYKEGYDFTENGYRAKTKEIIDLNVEVLPYNATYKDVTWMVDDESVASINKNGELVGKKRGKVAVKAVSHNELVDTIEFEFYSVLFNTMVISLAICIPLLISLVIFLFIKKRKNIDKPYS